MKENLIFGITEHPAFKSKLDRFSMPGTSVSNVSSKPEIL